MKTNTKHLSNLLVRGGFRKVEANGATHAHRGISVVYAVLFQTAGRIHP